MKKLLRVLPWAAALLILVLLVFLLQYFTNKDDEMPKIILPPPATQSGNDDGSESRLTVADVTPETVVEILRELSRADSYARELTVETIWAEGSGTETLSVWAQGGALRVTSGKRNLLLRDEGLWLWYSDDSRVRTSKRDALAQADRYQRILTYEDLLDGEHEILEASYTALEGEPCIFVAYRDGAFDYLNRLYVSVASGLLVAAETYDGETCIYRMSSGTVDLSTPDETLLTPPEGEFFTTAAE